MVGADVLGRPPPHNLNCLLAERSDGSTPAHLCGSVSGEARICAIQRAGFQHVLRDTVAPAASDDHLGRPALPELRLEELPHLVRELPPLCGLHGDAVPGHALGLLVPVSFLAFVPIQLARDGRNRF